MTNTAVESVNFADIEKLLADSGLETATEDGKIAVKGKGILLYPGPGDGETKILNAGNGKVITIIKDEELVDYIKSGKIAENWAKEWAADVKKAIAGEGCTCGQCEACKAKLANESEDKFKFSKIFKKDANEGVDAQTKQDLNEIAKALEETGKFDTVNVSTDNANAKFISAKKGNDTLTIVADGSKIKVEKIIKGEKQLSEFNNIDELVKSANEAVDEDGEDITDDTEEKVITPDEVKQFLIDNGYIYANEENPEKFDINIDAINSWINPEAKTEETDANESVDLTLEQAQAKLEEHNAEIAKLQPIVDKLNGATKTSAETHEDAAAPAENAEADLPKEDDFDIFGTITEQTGLITTTEEAKQNLKEAAALLDELTKEE